MKNTIMNNKLISRFAHWEPARILVASLLLAATVITGLPMAIKLFCVALAMFVLLVTKCRQEEYTEIQIFGVCFAVAMGPMCPSPWREPA